MKTITLTELAWRNCSPTWWIEANGTKGTEIHKLRERIRAKFKRRCIRPVDPEDESTSEPIIHS